MKWIWFLLILTLSFARAADGSATSISKPAAPRIDAYEGKLFSGPKDPEYNDYDLALKNLLTKRIQKKYGVELPPGSFSGYDLLEIESFLRVKKSNEPLEVFLKMFPKTP